MMHDIASPVIANFFVSAQLKWFDNNYNIFPILLEPN